MRRSASSRIFEGEPAPVSPALEPADETTASPGEPHSFTPCLRARASSKGLVIEELSTVAAKSLRTIQFISDKNLGNILTTWRKYERNYPCGLAYLFKKDGGNRLKDDEVDHGRDKKLPYGISNFKRLRHPNSYLVDRSRFIRKIEKAGAFAFQTRPRLRVLVWGHPTANARKHRPAGVENEAPGECV